MHVFAVRATQVIAFAKGHFGQTRYLPEQRDMRRRRHAPGGPETRVQHVMRRRRRSES
jgi:hypothetical protein